MCSYRRVSRDAKLLTRRDAAAPSIGRLSTITSSQLWSRGLRLLAAGATPEQMLGKLWRTRRCVPSVGSGATSTATRATTTRTCPQWAPAPLCKRRASALPRRTKPTLQAPLAHGQGGRTAEPPRTNRRGRSRVTCSELGREGRGRHVMPSCIVQLHEQPVLTVVFRLVYQV